MFSLFFKMFEPVLWFLKIQNENSVSDLLAKVIRGTPRRPCGPGNRADPEVVHTFCRLVESGPLN